MVSWIGKLFDTSDFPARWHCGNWSSAHGWTHVVSDSIIFAAYVAIPLVLIYFVRRRPDVPKPRIFVLFAAFIVCCGTVHLIEAIIFWNPVYRFSALVKVTTALVSVGTVAALIPTVPQLLVLKGPKELQEEVQKRTAALERSNEELDRFAHAASHDLKGPLRALKNAADWIEEDLNKEQLTEDMKENLELLKNRSGRMEALLDGLLEYARVGRNNVPPEGVDVGEILNNVITLLSPAPTIEIDWPSNTPRLRAAKAPLQQVFMNLLSNALKHHDKERGRVSIWWRDAGEALIFSVKDDGPGIDPRLHGKIFEIFQTGRSRDEVEGAGIGLAVVKKVVENHGGRVWLDSAPAQGSTFYFSWPKTAVTST